MARLTWLIALMALGGSLAPAAASGEGCTNSCAAGQYRQTDCSCATCTACPSGSFVAKHCDETGGLRDTECQACTTECGRNAEGVPQFMSTKCAVDEHKKVDAMCTTCTDCCPLAGTPASGIECKKTQRECGDSNDSLCGYITDWEAKVTTGLSCGTRCGQAVEDKYTSTDTTWAFIITDKNDDLVFQGLPNVTDPCTVTGIEAQTKCKNVPLSEPLGTSSGFAPLNVRVLPAMYSLKKDSWCMQTFCMSSAQAGVRFEYNPAPEIDVKAAAEKSLWLNPSPSGPCGGANTEWTFELTGPLKGVCP